MRVTVVFGVLAVLSSTLATAPETKAQGRGRKLLIGSGLSYEIEARDARLNRRVTGAVTRSVDGVPAEPVDSFVWDGNGSTPIAGQLNVRVDPITDQGLIEASWRDEHGFWTFRQSAFSAPPDRPSGVRYGKSVQVIRPVQEGVAHNVFMFGDTGAGLPVLPTVFSHIATWGPAELTLNGKPFLNPFDDPGSAWTGRVLVTEGVRHPDGTVRALANRVYDPSLASEGLVETGDLEVHVMVHDRQLPPTSNVPAEFEFFYHVVFEEVTIRVLGFDPSTPLATFEGIPGPPPAPPAAEDGADQVPPVRYRAIATKPRRNRRVMGPVIEEVDGVPAEPVDSFVWHGNGATPIEGELILEVLPDFEHVGIIRATWTDEHGEWLYFQTRFIHPEHSSGVRIGPTTAEPLSLINEGITHNVYLHGDTTAGQPILPTLFNHLATWGPADVWLNGQPFENRYELPAPQWLGHLMVTEGVRLPDGTVRTESGEIYNPMRLTEGAVQEGDLEVHLVFHDERFPRNSNIPPLFSFFYHLVFEEVSLEIIQEPFP